MHVNILIRINNSTKKQFISNCILMYTEIVTTQHQKMQLSSNNNRRLLFVLPEDQQPAIAIDITDNQVYLT